jgi:hypothetical protein
MKKLALTIALLSIAGIIGLFANPQELTSKFENSLTVTVKKLSMPYSSVGKIEMEKVYQKGNYVLYRCQENVVDKFPGANLAGKTFKYFVYKNNKLHLSVTENNKQDVYRYFSA